jgi:aspartyl/asparaginyl beta-hydroxylase (cupin superfamily)
MTNPMLDLRETPEDLANLQDELRANEDCWLLDTSRQDKITCQRDTQTIFLRVAATAQAPGIPNPSIHPSRDSKVSRRFPRIMAWLDHFSTQLEGELGRVLLVRLKPGGKVYRHIDQGDYYRVRHRFHVMLNSPEGCWLECGDERWETRTGQIVWFDNKCPYEEGNPTGEWSVRMIVDFLPRARPPIASQFKNFALMKVGVDVGPMLEEIDGQPQLWDADTRRQTNIQVQRETSNIPLRGVLKPIPEGINQKNWHPTCRTPFADHCPRIYSWVEQSVKELGGDLSRISVVRLNPHGRVYPHIDDGDYYKVRDRYHLVLRSPGGSEMNAGGENVVFRDGELWWFNNKAVHDAFNPSDQGRVHVIFDVLPSRPAPFWVDLEADARDPITPEQSSSTSLSDPASDGDARARETPAQVDPLAGMSAAVRAILAGRMIPAAGPSLLGPGTGVVLVELRASGRLVGRGWSKGSDYWEGLCQALGALREQPSTTAANELMLSVGGRSCELALADESAWRRLESNHSRGLFGYEIRPARDPALVVMVSPFELIASNRSIIKTLGQSIAHFGLSTEEARAGGVTLSEFETRRFRIDLGRDDASAVPLVRARRLVPLEEVTLDSMARLQELLGDYLVRSVQPDGRMVYLYHPSRGTEDRTRNNAIRQWMATRALIRVWQRRGSGELLQTVRKNVDFNLKTMYAEEGELGLILEKDKVKLGAVALAALALTESPFAQEFATVRDRLATTVDFLWRQDGAFRTFYQPVERNDCQNFYPGEALLFWAKRIVATRDPALLERFHQSFRYYQNWHMENRNPAFIPWHTQAMCIVWEMTREDELADAVFTMNDWLLGVQQWETAPSPDCQGRFFDPSRPFGPPHASSTAVYLEGLAEALALARAVGERDRIVRYRTAILRGLRSLYQLTFKDDVDMFYVTKRESVRGGVQSTEYDNAVRVDNVQHAITAVDKILKVLSAEDNCS